MASGRRVHDLTLLCINEDNFNDNGDYIVFWPLLYGSKTDKPNYQQSGWKIMRNFDSDSCCPVFWIRHVINLSNEKRGSLKHLFLTTNSEVKPASRTVIAS